ncbi:hypothetical protein [Pontibacter sp. SGAir0037]|uniref:hypothetical protein n=1 Tax=Pontibacter sp. SGAir0037 TaxID=2571030 RepID=UPI0010CCFB47|nr:hypothetical protein [Pontibacter sp. SGAir0037]QCR23741.1 hypothetical protein C1N53_16235 [Pontibacter sp. SGAir0037]
MRYEEEDQREQDYDEHPEHRDSRGERAPREGEEFNDFRSRWDEPVPLFRNQRRRFYENDDQPFREYMNQRHPEDLRRREEWRPQNRREDYREQEGNRYDGSGQEPNWRRQDVDFNEENQHANDRWSQDNYMPHPERQREEYERYRWELEQRRNRLRNRQGYRNGEEHERND